MPKDLLDSIIDTIIREKRKKGWVSPELMQWTADQIIKHILPADGEVGDDAPFSSGEGSGVRSITDEQRRQVQVFSGFKTYHQLSQATALLYDKQGRIRPFSAFKRDILALDQEYNVRYLKAEYELAYANIQSINTWNSFQAIKGSMPFVRYDTAHDERVREAHARMDGVIKHIDDAFWDTWWPPNGWGCRCDVAPVASDIGGKPVPPDIVPPKTMFANNVGKNGVIFPKGHPYYKAPAAIAKQVEDDVAAQAGTTAAQLMGGKMLKDFAERILPKLSSSIRQAITSYTWAAFLKWNKALRTGAKLPGEVLAIREVMAANPTAYAVKVFRGVSDDVGIGLLEQLQKLGIGEVFNDSTGFISTSLDPLHPKILTRGKVILQIDVPVGARALYIQALSGTPEEMELLIDHDTDFRILGFREDGGKHYIHLALIP